MKRLLGLAVLGLALSAVPARANGLIGPGYFDFGANFYGQWGHGAPPWACGGGQPGYGPGGPVGGGGGGPTVLGPWYNYWPLEAHFQVPAHPQYPYWPAPQVLPNGAPAAGTAPPGYYVPANRSW